MNKNNTSVWLIAILCLAVACKNLFKSPDSTVNTASNSPDLTNTQPFKDSSDKNTSADIYTKAAIETCHCIQPMVEKAKNLKELEKNKQTGEIKKIVREMEQIQPQVQKCSDEIRQKYSKLNNVADQKLIFKALEKQCPDIATLFSNFSKIKKQ